ncbi:MAG: hypothetical protein F4Y27_09590 [Acidimicrobiaceae bacterium]|nr:hypothetical protein [Acidimicrobiaceae bacterium]MXW75265.1 hypothetical protein [Acidimicrobiaceae bacterium]MYA74918.1 hypothetical protein [Acidimicrobiaceae bacterium]MYD07205.1 hypothetical protein [Acidimicrobiaceae bacterium]MYG56713.1 hypothetical protein [Acidimicrobiaceae bacterium]
MRTDDQTQLWVVVACGATIAYSVVIALVRFFGSEGEPGSLRISVSLVAPFVVAALVALLAHSVGRGRFVMAAGAGIIPAAVISVVALPLWIPAIMLLVAGWRQTTPGSAKEMAASIVVTIGIFSAMIALLVNRDPLEWYDGPVDQYSNNTITASESLLSATILGLVIIIALAAARPQAVDEADADDPDG